MLLACVGLLACSAATLSPAAATLAASSGASGDTVASRELAAGVTYRMVVDTAGPWVMHVIRVSLRQDGIELREAHALDRLTGRERTTAIARRVEERG